jgi:hypothetical protein
VTAQMFLIEHAVVVEKTTSETIQDHFAWTLATIIQTVSTTVVVKSTIHAELIEVMV